MTTRSSPRRRPRRWRPPNACGTTRPARRAAATATRSRLTPLEAAALPAAPVSGGPGEPAMTVLSLATWAFGRRPGTLPALVETRSRRAAQAPFSGGPPRRAPPSPRWPPRPGWRSAAARTVFGALALLATVAMVPLLFRGLATPILARLDAAITERGILQAELDAAGKRRRRSSATSPITTSSPACPTGASCTTASASRSRNPIARCESPRRALPRSRRLQGRERLPRARLRRPPAGRARRPRSQQRPRRGHRGPLRGGRVRRAAGHV